MTPNFVDVFQCVGLTLYAVVVAFLIFHDAARAQQISPGEFGKSYWTEFSIAPSRNFVLSDGNRQAVINFSGEAVTFSGDMPVDEAARMFFERVMKYKMQDCKK